MGSRRHQQQSRDALDRLRHLRPALHGAAHARRHPRSGRARGRAGGAGAVRRADAAQRRHAAGAGWRAYPWDVAGEPRHLRGSPQVRGAAAGTEHPPACRLDRDDPARGYPHRGARGRPSAVLGARGMVIARSMDDLREAAADALAAESGPVLLDRYLEGLEVELDAVADGTNGPIPALMEQVERAGVHSGDSLALLPARSVHPDVARVIVDYAARISWALQVRGFLNIQFVIWKGRPYVLEVNLRASPTVPFVSKATGVPMVGLATEGMLGRSLAEVGYAGVRRLGVPGGVGRPLLLSAANHDRAARPDLAAAAHAAGFTITAPPGTAAALAARGL